MKKLLLFTLVFSSIHAFSQGYSDTMTFESGAKIPFYNYNENMALSKYNLILTPVNPVFLGEGTIFMFNLGGFVRVNPKILIEGKIGKSYGVSADIISLKGVQKTSYEISGIAHYLFRSNTKSKKSTVNFGFATYENNSHFILAYKPEIEFERVVKYYFSGGLNLLRTSGNYRIASLNSPQSSLGLESYFIGNINSVSILGGVMRETVSNYQYGYENTYGENKVSSTKRRTKRMRTYAYLTFAPVINYQVYDPIQAKEVTSGYTDVTDYRRLGWRFGGDMKISTFKAGPYVGFEFGRVHGVKVPNQAFFGSSYFSLKIGAELGFGYKKLGLKRNK